MTPRARPYIFVSCWTSIVAVTTTSDRSRGAILSHVAASGPAVEHDAAMTDFPLPYDNADLAGQVALVTGASSGLGRRFALTLAAAGASVAACARRVEKLDDLVAEITASGGNAVSVPLDVSDATAIAGAVDAAEAAFGRSRSW